MLGSLCVATRCNFHNALKRACHALGVLDLALTEQDVVNEQMGPVAQSFCVAVFL